MRGITDLVTASRKSPRSSQSDAVLNVSLASYETVLKRWPYILTGVVNEVYRLNHDLTLQSFSAESTSEERESLLDQIDEGKKIIESISLLKYRMARDMVME
jgi:damage-control phosphatase, subfamily III